jgi:glutamate synthase (NADPH/NADH) small chain
MVSLRPEPKDINRKARMKIPHQPVPKRPVAERIHDFREVYLGYDPETAVIEASRCLQCPKPKCVEACPVHNDIPRALWLIEHKDFSGAAEVVRETNNLPEICGRVCPQERLCQGSCVVGKRQEPVAIGRLEAFATDYQRHAEGLPMPEHPPLSPPPRPPEPESLGWGGRRGGQGGGPPTGKHIAVVGSGPAGLVVAEELVKNGHAVTVYEAWPYPGGILIYGIPDFKLDKAIVKARLCYLAEMGVEFVTSTRIGEALTVDDLLCTEGFDAVFLGTGAGIPAQLDVPGVHLDNIYDATDFLVRANPDETYLPLHQKEPPVVGRRVAVIGGGDTAMDCVRTAVRLGAEEVTCVYRRTEDEMPGVVADRELAREEGVKFQFLCAPVRFIGDALGRVMAMECVWMKLGEPDASGRPRPVPIEGSEFTMYVDTVVLAIGYWPDPLIGETTPGLETHRWGLIVVDEATGQTSRSGVFAGGDNVHGPDLVVTAMAAGRRAAAAIDEYLHAEPATAISE